jgi:hypothetical protein
VVVAVAVGEAVAVKVAVAVAVLVALAVRVAVGVFVGAVVAVLVGVAVCVPTTVVGVRVLVAWGVEVAVDRPGIGQPRPFTAVPAGVLGQASCPRQSWPNRPGSQTPSPSWST